MNITALSDIIARGRRQGKFICMASVNVEAAFDTAPHQHVLETLREWETPDRILRYAHMWMRQRQFSLRLQGTVGAQYSRYYKNNEGATAGGRFFLPAAVSAF